VIPPEYNGDFVAAMENVLDVYKRPYNPAFPVVCMDETPKQLIRETRTPISIAPGRAERHDYEYERCGVCNIFMANEPLEGKRLVKVTERRTKPEWAQFIKEVAQHYKSAEKITLVMDNLNTHKAGSLYETFAPEEAKRIWDRFDFVYTPKHGSWLNMAEIELNVLGGQCLSRRIDTIAEVTSEVSAWQTRRDNLNAKINWQFRTEDARVKLRRLYPTLET
jgi:transposase